MNDQIILTIAQAILKNTEVLQTLVNDLPKEVQSAVLVNVLPKETQAAIEEKVTKTVKNSPAPAVPQPVLAPVVVEVPVTPVVAPVPAPVAPVLDAPAQVIAPSNAPFKTQPELVKWIMGKYQALGPVKGGAIQGVISGLGYSNINEIKPEHYDAVFAGVEAL